MQKPMKTVETASSIMTLPTGLLSRNVWTFQHSTLHISESKSERLFCEMKEHFFRLSYKYKFITKSFRTVWITTHHEGGTTEGTRNFYLLSFLYSDALLPWKISECCTRNTRARIYIYLMIQPTMNSSALDPHAFIFVHLKRLNGDQWYDRPS